LLCVIKNVSVDSYIVKEDAEQERTQRRDWAQAPLKVARQFSAR